MLDSKNQEINKFIGEAEKDIQFELYKSVVNLTEEQIKTGKGLVSEAIKLIREAYETGDQRNVSLADIIIVECFGERKDLLDILQIANLPAFYDPSDRSFRYHIFNYLQKHVSFDDHRYLMEINMKLGKIR